jgi:hypothetical protein
VGVLKDSDDFYVFPVAGLIKVDKDFRNRLWSLCFNIIPDRIQI